MKTTIKTKLNKRGFTLVEVVVVLVIIAILAAIAIPSLTGYIKDANKRKETVNARYAVTALQAIILKEFEEYGGLYYTQNSDPNEMSKHYIQYNTTTKMASIPTSGVGQAAWKQFAGELPVQSKAASTRTINAYVSPNGTINQAVYFAPEEYEDGILLAITFKAKWKTGFYMPQDGWLDTSVGNGYYPVMVTTSPRKTALPD